MSLLYTRFDPVFFEKTRLSIITLAYQDVQVTYNRLKKKLEITDGALYSHLKKLTDNGYLDQRKEISPHNSVQTVYTLTPKGRDTFAGYLQFMQDFLQQRRSTE